MKVLVGSTGLVGSTLRDKINFDFEFNSKNISDFLSHDINGCDLYLSCLPATKWMVNKNVIDDLENIVNLIKIFNTKSYNKIYLISTIDVYGDSPQKVDEDYLPNYKNSSYGSNRLLFESLVRTQLKYEKCMVFRLSALFNNRIKKNILFDLINNNNIDKINTNSTYQWYNLDQLSKDIYYLESRFPYEEVFNLFTEPLDTRMIVDLFPQHKNSVFFGDTKIEYNYKTKYFDGGYFKDNLEILNDIKDMVNEFINK